MHGQRGFTLLELLVVLGLIGLVAGVVAPRFLDLQERLGQRNQLQEIRQRLNGLPLIALRQASPLQIDAKGAPFEPPLGWRLSARQPIVYQSNGVCLGGELEIWHRQTRLHTLQLQAPYCKWPS